MRKAGLTSFSAGSKLRSGHGDKHQIWLDYYFAVFPGHYMIASVAAGFFFYVFGTLISWGIGFIDTYIRTLGVYLGAIGIAWVSAWAGWASREFPLVIQRVRPALLISEPDFDSFSNAWKHKIYDNRLYVAGSTSLAFLSWIFLSLSVYSFKWLPWLPPAWLKEPNLLAKVVIVCIYATPVAFLVFTTGAGIIAYCAFVHSLSKTPIVPIVEFARIKLRPTTDFAIRTGLAWSVGVSLFVLLFRPAFDVPSTILVTTLTGLGLLMLLAPQLALHNSLEHVKESLLDQSYGQFVEHESKLHTTLHWVRSSPHLNTYDVMRSIAETRTWVYDPARALSVLGTWLIPVFTMAVNALLRH